MNTATRLRRLDPDAIRWPNAEAATTFPDVSGTIDFVKWEGDRALTELAAQFGDPAPHLISRDQLREAYESIDAELRAALEAAAKRIETFARSQRATLTDVTIELGSMRVGHQARPMKSAGAYVPGGRYPLVSTALMCVIPAKVAGVERVVVCSPSIAKETLASAYIAGADEFFVAGGAQAIAALAYGTQTVLPVDIIVGPGNAYVTAAKRLVYGICGIDAIAGPSEVVVIASGGADPACVAADLLAQAEHDPMARAMLVTDKAAFADAVDSEIERQLATLSTEKIARAAIASQGCAVILPLENAVDAVNALAPEHLELQGAAAEALAGRFYSYGALFIGSNAAEVFGDYGAGPNHTLPTNGTARFTSGLSVFTFLTIHTFQTGLSRDEAFIRQTAILAKAEGLDAHRRAAEKR